MYEIVDESSTQTQVQFIYMVIELLLGISILVYSALKDQCQLSLFPGLPWWRSG